MQVFWKGRAFFTGIAVILLFLSILCRFATGMLLKKLIREAGNMSATDNRFLKQCKLKFQNCLELNGGTVNVEVFVEKALQNIRLGKYSLKLLNFMAGQLLLLSVFTDGIGICMGLSCGESPGDILPWYVLAFFSLYMFFSVSGFIDVEARRETLKITMMDFLENRMVKRAGSVKADSDYLEEEEKKAEETELQPGGAQIADTDELEELLREFLA